MKFFRSLFLMSMAMTAAVVLASLPSVALAVDQMEAASSSPRMLATTTDLFQVLVVLAVIALAMFGIIMLIARRLNRSGGVIDDNDYGYVTIFNADPERSAPS